MNLGAKKTDILEYIVLQFCKSINFVFKFLCCKNINNMNFGLKPKPSFESDDLKIIRIQIKYIQLLILMPVLLSLFGIKFETILSSYLYLLLYSVPFIFMYANQNVGVLWICVFQNIGLTAKCSHIKCFELLYWQIYWCRELWHFGNNLNGCIFDFTLCVLSTMFTHCNCVGLPILKLDIWIFLTL